MVAAGQGAWHGPPWQTYGNIDTHLAPVGQLGLELMVSFLRRDKDTFIKVGWAAQGPARRRPHADPCCIHRVRKRWMCGQSIEASRNQLYAESMIASGRATAATTAATQRASAVPMGVLAVETVRGLSDHVHAFHKDCT